MVGNRNPVLNSLAGTFLVLDGVDGAGKTTVQGLLAERLARMGLQVTLCKDPGGTEIGNRIRSVLLDHDLASMSLACETLLFMASRAQLITEVVRPALARGAVVLCDRYVSSTCAYQGAIGADRERIIELADYATDSMWPDLTVILDVPVEVGVSRIGQRVPIRQRDFAGAEDEHLDAMERRPLSFHERVRRNFLSLRDDYPGPIAVVDATQTPEQVTEAVLEAFAQFASTQTMRSTGS